MGRARIKNRHLPRWMHHKHGAYYFVRAGKWLRLSNEYGPALIEYSKLVGDSPRVTTVEHAILHYMGASADRLAPATLEGYRISAERLIPVFGHVALDALTPADVYRYLIEHGNVQANRDKALLSAAYSEARRIGAFSGDDPAKGLHYRNPEKPRERYVTDDEFARILAAASPKLATIARFIELTGTRQSDALRVKLSDIDDEGIHYAQGKTGKRLVVTWSDELRAVVADANRLWRRFGRAYLFESKPRGKHHKQKPGPYTPSGLRALWRVAREKAGLPDVRLHDLRGKAGSDLPSLSAAQKLLGHSDAKVTARHYRRKPERVPPTR